MTFHDWLYSVYPPNSAMEGQWGIPHIITLLLCIGCMIGFTLLGKRYESKKRVILIVLASLALFFEISRRIINLTRGNEMDFTALMKTLLPRPWCAISCIVAIIAVFLHKKFFYNFSATTGILCALVFFAYPGAGFTHNIYLFENYYSIFSHSLFFILSVLFITLGFTDFRYIRGEGIWKSALPELIALAVTYLYGFLEIHLLKIERDPLYFMKGNEIEEILGCSHGVYLVIYIGFLLLFFNAFYLIPYFIRKRKAQKGK
jgi:hypothetical protein